MCSRAQMSNPTRLLDGRFAHWLRVGNLIASNFDGFNSDVCSTKNIAIGLYQKVLFKACITAQNAISANNARNRIPKVVSGTWVSRQYQLQIVLVGKVTLMHLLRLIFLVSFIYIEHLSSNNTIWTSDTVRAPIVLAINHPMSIPSTTQLVACYNWSDSCPLFIAMWSRRNQC
jgi:hypothetical protein